mmetsp:Transcript_39381/g.125666  ORF Transcript_39381/g.125666 Transcript_39381/m.125666 type:complete len:126 (-) Transcript_39381:95-472(-)
MYWPGAKATADVLAGGKGGEGGGAVSLAEFSSMMEEPAGFPVLGVLEKLEQADRGRHGGFKCSVCTYSIVGPRYGCKNHNFSLCSNCYGEGKVPASIPATPTYVFKEHVAETRTGRLKYSLGLRK